MRLNQIEISGFKSFPERAELSFDGGVTAIVGPNGCGKSNVIDAITWVLGEQNTRSLRGERMEDVIFSGSDARRPTAAAEVRLQLSQVTAALASLGRVIAASDQSHPKASINGSGNGVRAEGQAQREPFTQGSEAGLAVADITDLKDELDDGPTIARDVEVGRRLYRSGESEYLIDGQVCRLRDIQDLLMDSGVGIKAYAVIEQGKIGQILGARPLERRQLLEEAAGVTKYKSRRRAAELKLEAAKQNLTRVDDIVFEVEKQRGALKRQAAKARRYRRLREELRRWEKVLFAHKSAVFRRVMETAQSCLDAASNRANEVAEVLLNRENSHEHLRLDLVESEQGSTVSRDAAHAHELLVERRQQQIEFDKGQLSSLVVTANKGQATLRALEARRSPLLHELTEQVHTRERCDTERDEANKRQLEVVEEYTNAQHVIEGVEGDVEAARSEVFAAVNAATALKHVVQHAVAGNSRIADELAKLGVEASDVETERQKVTDERTRVEAAAKLVSKALETTRLERVDQEAGLNAARLAKETHSQQAHNQERELTSMTARLRSLEEIAASREGYSDAARLVLSDLDSDVPHLGSVADHLEMDREHECAVEASLNEFLQYVIVEHQQDALKGITLATTRGSGRCGFLITENISRDIPVASSPDPSLIPLADLVRVVGPAALAVKRLLMDRWVAPSFEVAAVVARKTTDPIVTREGVVFEGASVVGGGKRGTRGILATKGEIGELQGQVTSGQEVLQRLNADVDRCGAKITKSEAKVETLQSVEHSHEKELLELELRATSLNDGADRLGGKRDLIETERRTAEEEHQDLIAKECEAREAITRLEADQRVADERFMAAQARLLESRETVDVLGKAVTEAKALYAALAERATALAGDVKRLEDTTKDLDQRVNARAADNLRAVSEHESLVASILASEHQFDEDRKQLKVMRENVRVADVHAAELRDGIERDVVKVREAREGVEAARAEVVRLELKQVTAATDHANLVSSCAETLQLSLEEVEIEVDQMERDGIVAPHVAMLELAKDLAAEDDVSVTSGVEDVEGDPSLLGQPIASDRPTAETVIAELRDKVDRLGPVNMMAIDQFDELEERYEFLTTQRKDLLDAIDTTGQAIKRIDATTRERFKSAFVAINDHFQTTFSTLFGGGSAGLVLLDESDVLESGIDIIAQPPGKRLQSIQLLSGGEKALTAMALMFSVFKYKPSPFCLLDEIDAPLDELNIGRFVNMLRGMQDHTQFVLVTHNRKTMEIADRLYGVTMEEPGVSKLISVKLN